MGLHGFSLAIMVFFIADYCFILTIMGFYGNYKFFLAIMFFYGDYMF